MKHFIKAMYREGSGFAFFQKFPQIIMEKLKANIFDDPQIKDSIKNKMFDKALSEVELSARQSLKSVVTNFLGNDRGVECVKEIEELLQSFSQHCAPISVKLHFLW